MHANAITPPWMIEELRRRRHEREERDRPRMERPIPTPDREYERDDDRPGSRVWIIEPWS